MCPAKTLNSLGISMRPANSDQTERMSRLIWLFSGRTGHFVGLFVLWVIIMLKKDFIRKKQKLYA